MAFTVNTLERIGGLKGRTPQVWCYKTNDARATVDTAGYFDNGATANTGGRTLFQKGDIIYIYSDADSSHQYGWAIVNEVAAGVVDIASMTIMGTADTD